MLLPMLVDSGADCTLVPAATVRQLGLPLIDTIGLVGVGGTYRRATVHAAVVELGDLRVIARVVAFLDEAILGRDIMNQAVVVLDGPRLETCVKRQAVRRNRAR
jgi:predicted aspartyl protease